MPLHRTDAFVLRTYTLKEADKICVLFTRDSGKVRAVAKGARKLRSRFGSSLEPLTEVALSYYQKENQELASISTCDILRTQFSDEITSERLGALHYIAELVIEFVPDHEPNERIYRLVGAIVEAMRSSGSPELPAISRYFEVLDAQAFRFFGRSELLSRLWPRPRKRAISLADQRRGAGLPLVQQAARGRTTARSTCGPQRYPG